MSRTTDYAASRYRYAMRECQWVALYLYQVYRAEPTAEAGERLRMAGALLREITQQAKQVPLPPCTVPMLQLDSAGLEVRRSIGP